MRWFDPDLDDDEWAKKLNEYGAHLDRISAKLPPEVLALARDGQYDLHDAHPVDIDIDVPGETVRIVADASTPAGEWHRLALLFEGAAVVPDNFQRLAFAVGAAFRKTGPFGPTTTVIHYQELDIAADGRYVLWLRLWPFHEFEVWFRRMTSTDAPISQPTRRSRGNVSLVPSRDIHRG